MAERKIYNNRTSPTPTSTPGGDFTTEELLNMECYLLGDINGNGVVDTTGTHLIYWMYFNDLSWGEGAPDWWTTVMEFEEGEECSGGICQYTGYQTNFMKMM